MAISGLSDTSLDQVLNYVFRNAAPAWASENTFLVALYTAAPTVGADATVSEAAYTSYTRVALTKSTGLTVSAHTLVNTGDITFPKMTGGATQNVTHVGLVGGSGNGQVVAIMALPVTVQVNVDSVPIVSAGSMSFTATRST
jgi:hypothetical protein